MIRAALGAVLLVAAVAACWDAWVAIGRTAIFGGWVFWTSAREHAQIWLAPLAAAWLLWCYRGRWQTEPRLAAWIGPALMGLGLISYSGLSRATDITSLIEGSWHGGALLMAAGAIATAWAGRVRWGLLPALVPLLLIVPIPGYVHVHLGRPLRAAAEELAKAGAFILPVTAQSESANPFQPNAQAAGAALGRDLHMIYAVGLLAYTYAFSRPVRTWVRLLLLVAAPVVGVFAHLGCHFAAALSAEHTGLFTQETAAIAGDWLALPAAVAGFALIELLLRWLLLPVDAQGRPSRNSEMPPHPIVESFKRAVLVHGDPASGNARAFLARRLAPLAGVALLFVVAVPVAESYARLPWKSVERFRAEVRQAIDALPREVGPWRKKEDRRVSESARRMLHPIADTYQLYTHEQTGQTMKIAVIYSASARSMLGHAPAVCYGGQFELLGRRSDVLKAAGMKIPVERYRFLRRGRGFRTVVHHTVLLAGRGPMRNMDKVAAAADDLQRRLYGAGQIQVILPDTMPEGRRRQIARRMFEMLGGVLHAVRDGVWREGARPGRDGNRAGSTEGP